MECFSAIDEARVRAAVKAVFPDYKISFMCDPDDKRIVLLRMYDVAEQDMRNFKNNLYDILDGEFSDMSVELIPSVVSSEDTQKYYAEYLRAEVQVSEDEIALLVGSSKRDKSDWCRPENSVYVRWNTSKSVAKAKPEWANDYRNAA